MFNEIVNFLAHRYSASDDFERLVTRAFHGHPNLLSRIDLDGSPHEVATRLVNLLRRYGEIETDTQALWHLLLTAKEEFGLDIQAEIDTFESYANHGQRRHSPTHREPLQFVNAISDNIETASPEEAVKIHKPIRRKSLRLILLITISILLTGISLIGALQLINRRESSSTQTPPEIVHDSTPNETSTNTPTYTITPISFSDVQNTARALDEASLTSQFITAVAQETQNIVTQQFVTATYIAQLSLTPPATSTPTLAPPTETFTASPSPTNTSTPMPQNGLIALRKRDGQIYTMKIDGTEVKRLTTQGFNTGPKWSPNGQWIAFLSYQSNEDDDDIYIMPVDGSYITLLTTRGKNIIRLEWLPDWRISFRVLENAHEYYDCVIYADGSNLSCSATTTDGAWSPDGQLFIYALAHSDNINSLWDIYIYEPETEYTKIILTTTGPDGEFVWSPDSQKVIFLGDWDKNTLENVYVINADGNGLKQLTSEGNYSSVEWSPDGEQIIFSFSPTLWEYFSLGSDIYLIPVDGGQIRQLTTDKGDDASWQPIPWYITLTPNP